MSNSKSYGFEQQLQRGEAGVMVAKMVLRGRYPMIKDFATDMEMQKRGIDLYVEGLGFVEIKSDYHDESGNFFIEVCVGKKPGALDNSNAEYFCYIYPKSRRMYLLPRAYIAKWLRENWAYYVKHDKVIRIQSHQGRSTWSADGVTINRDRLIRYIKRSGGHVVYIHWNEEEEVLHNTDWENGDI